MATAAEREAQSGCQIVLRGGLLREYIVCVHRGCTTCVWLGVPVGQTWAEEEPDRIADVPSPAQDETTRLARRALPRMPRWADNRTSLSGAGRGGTCGIMILCIRLQENSEPLGSKELRVRL